jgi:3,4-dihydroxy-2-butanone 4-phosphate synthase
MDKGEVLMVVEEEDREEVEDLLLEEVEVTRCVHIVV